jgi:hypothetical protein
MINRLLSQGCRLAKRAIAQAKPALPAAAVADGRASNGGTLALQKQAPTRALADKLRDEGLATPFKATPTTTYQGILARPQCLPGDWSASKRRYLPSTAPTMSTIPPG